MIITTCMLRVYSYVRIRNMHIHMYIVADMLWSELVAENYSRINWIKHDIHP